VRKPRIERRVLILRGEEGLNKQCLLEKRNSGLLNTLAING
jgi:hypothetical protein